MDITSYPHDLIAAVNAGVVSLAQAQRIVTHFVMSTVSCPSIEVQHGDVSLRAKCEHCGQWGDRFDECGKCGAPID